MSPSRLKFLTSMIAPQSFSPVPPTLSISVTPHSCMVHQCTLVRSVLPTQYFLTLLHLRLPLQTYVSTFIQLQAEDCDSGANGRLSFSLISKTDIPLHVDSSSGRLYLDDGMDNNHDDHYDVIISATDGKRPYE